MTWQPHYKIVPGSAGSFLEPPGHPSHRYTLEGYETTRKRNPFFIGSIARALADDFDGSDAIKRRVQKIFDEADIHPSELWLRSVYSHFRNCYAPDSGSTNASDVVIHSRPEIAVGKVKPVLDQLRTVQEERVETRKAVAAVGGSLPEEPGLNVDNYRRGVTPLYGRRRGWEVTAKTDGTKVRIYALADDGTRYDADHLDEFAAALESSDEFTDVRREHICDKHAGRVEATLTNPPPALNPERHSAVVNIRKHFPDHEPRLDLIDNPRPTTGPCDKCGEQVQYEGKFDKLATVSTRVDGTGMTHWSYGTECPQGGDHER